MHVLKQNVVLRDRCRRSDGVLEDRNGSLRGRCKESDTLWKSWQAQCLIVDVAKTLAGACVIRRIAFCVAGAGNPHHGCYVLRSKGSILRRVAFLELELEDPFAWPVQHFVWPRVMISWQAQCFWNMFPFSWKSRRKRSFFSFRGGLAQNARLGAANFHFSGKSRKKRSFLKSGSSDFEEVSHKALLLEVRIFSFRGSLAELARLKYKTLMQVVQKDPNTEILSGTRILIHWSTRILLYKWSYRILLQVVQKDPHTEILRQRSYHRILIEVVEKDFETEILRKWSSRMLGVVQQKSEQRDTSNPKEAWRRDLAQVVDKDPDTEILYKWSYMILIEVVLSVRQDRSSRSLKRILMQILQQESDTEILHKWYYRILIQVVKKCSHRSWTGSWIPIHVVHVQKDPDTEILHKWSDTILIRAVQRSLYRVLAQVVLQHPDRSGRTGAWCRDLTQVVLQDDTSGPNDLAQVVLQDPDTGGAKK